ncbi:beta-glucuronosyltransferase GlcAT14A-like [Humulus lupulus]|uniref:beta-glucuronosyltransferase GlcAT14A-like n=1 Tax=Humulus lupulus TaxID=3486 RepID=UPI002B40AB97|nr:beta-glucuronosyltransferase GlcAT14A-like [Humulus lupulus]
MIILLVSVFFITCSCQLISLFFSLLSQEFIFGTQLESSPIMGAERKWLLTLFSAAFLSLIILLFSSILAFSFSKPFPSIVQVGSHYPSAFAYYIWGGRGDCDRMFRLLLAVYHPRNQYLLHLTVEASEEERQKLSGLVKSVAPIRAFGNVDVLGKPDRLTYMGSTNIATTLRAVAILLRLDSGWNWFITLTASDYPLLTQDDLSHVFSSVRRDLNFIDHTSDLGWKEPQRFQPIVVDPAIYLARRSQNFHATEKRKTLDAFKAFTSKSLQCSPSYTHIYVTVCVYNYNTQVKFMFLVSFNWEC